MEIIKKIILDTNFLLVPGQFHIDIFSEIENIMHYNYELYIIDKTIDELKKIVKNAKQVDKSAAKIALKLLEQKNIQIISTKNKEYKIVDDYILEIVTKDYFVATIDKELKKKLLSKGVKIIETKQKKYIKITDI